MGTINIIVTKNFKKEAKRLFKKYQSLKKELRELNLLLESNPKQGIPLGLNTFKIRIGVRSKGKGKSGGLRVITYKVEVTSDKITVYLLSIFDKSEQSSISKGLLKHLIEQISKDKGYDD